MEQLPVFYQEFESESDPVTRVTDMLNLDPNISIGTATDFGSTMEILITQQDLVNKINYFSQFGRIGSIVIGVRYVHEPPKLEVKNSIADKKDFL